MPLSSLNAEQAEAAKAPSGHNLIIASAGTGKTATIVGRIAYLLQSGYDPSDILLLTFTNKASSEMIARVAKIFGEKIAKNIESGTFHAVAYRYLRENYHIHLKQPKELLTLFKSIYDKRVFMQEDSKPYAARYLYECYSLFINSAPKQTFSVWLTEKNPQQESYVEIYEDIFAEFSELKKTHHYADYNDLLILYRKSLLQLKEPLFQEVLCDEYQDTNPLQDCILDALSPPSLFCVGDYDQSIYAFNGADISIISGFRQKYADARVLTLSKNYRSSKHILDLANRVIEKNERIYPKHLEVIKQGDFAPPKLLVYDELFLQYQGIAKYIALSNRPYEDTAIIFRNNSSADGLEASLRELNIPSKRKGSMSFFDTKEVSLLLDICSIVHNPRDMMAYIHTLSYGKGIGEAIAKDIYEALSVLGEGDCIKGMFQPKQSARVYKQRHKNTQLGLFDDFFTLESQGRFDEFIASSFASHPILQHPKIHKEGAIFLSNFYEMLHEIHTMRNPKVLVSHIASSQFFMQIAHMLAMIRAKNKDGIVDSERFENVLESIKRKCSLLYDLSRNHTDLGKFLNAMILGSSEAVEGSGVHLLSIHAAKGLEFQNVYIVDLMDGRFPNRKLMSKSGSLEEERRLFYVAITRAKENLVLSFAKKDALKNINYAPSTFLYEGELLHKDSVI
ncbi:MULTISPECIES: ATP-dependent helicase [Helicobacter]|uniref:DNA 3'-5' helicase n=5 Tax=Helicobacter typhlonius TaxID=76936 RepID=A0A099UEF7_9HELI|nr:MULTISPECIES: ATP-dependent helicase [Helicobacter]TLD78350.1 ATP-dependent helicase [Helicobacter typhlonius]TLD87102.1 ATP-dependent helicase [Helicobacter sp. MIT 03-1616]CUU39176.1 ATP-dependent DNA helicase UvrD/PcrA/Rep, epsilon proteobacterial type 1 [Helicobacter typhlonius]HCD73062.1 ATP-dependent helicase [Helicobacter sp.]